MKFAEHGNNTSAIDINLTQFGMWLCLFDEDYPFFRTAKMDDIYQVEAHHKTHLYWPTLDIRFKCGYFKKSTSFPITGSLIF